MRLDLCGRREEGEQRRRREPTPLHVEGAQTDVPVEQHVQLASAHHSQAEVPPMIRTDPAGAMSFTGLEILTYSL